MALDNNTYYYVRSRQKGAVFGLSAWGDVSLFKTKLAGVLGPIVASPASGTINLTPAQVFTRAAFSSDIVAVQVPKIVNSAIVGYVSANKSRVLVSTDWQMSKTSDFAVIDKSGTSLAGLTWSVTGLLENTTYYVRVRENFTFHQPLSADVNNTVSYSDTASVSLWGDTAIYATMVAYTPNQPSITSPIAGATGLYNTVTLASSAFTTVGASPHESSDWEISTQSNFSTIVTSLYNSTTSLLSATLSGLSENTTYYARCRHKNTAGGLSGWSAGVSFSTMVSFAPAKPTITNIANGVSKFGYGWYPVTSSAFSGKGTDTHASSSWQFSTTATFNAGTITSSVTNSATDKTTFTPVGLASSTVYYARVSYRGVDGVDSPWSDVVNFSIQADLFAYTAAGTFSATIPSGVISLDLEAQGSGGGSGAGGKISPYQNAGGGGSGEYLTSTISVVAGDVIATTIGTGGAPGTTENGGNGVSTVIKKNGVTILTARGGKGSIGITGGLVQGNGPAGENGMNGLGVQYRSGKGADSPSGGVGGAAVTHATAAQPGTAGTKGAGAGGAPSFVTGTSTGGRGGTGYASLKFKQGIALSYSGLTWAAAAAGGNMSHTTWLNAGQPYVAGMFNTVTYTITADCVATITARAGGCDINNTTLTTVKNLVVGDIVVARVGFAGEIEDLQAMTPAHQGGWSEVLVNGVRELYAPIAITINDLATITKQGKVTLSLITV